MKFAGELFIHGHSIGHVTEVQVGTLPPAPPALPEVIDFTKTSTFTVGLSEVYVNTEYFAALQRALARKQKKRQRQRRRALRDKRGWP